MYLVPHTYIMHWDTIGDTVFPTAVGAICPYCGQRVVFSAPTWEKAAAFKAHVVTSQCPSCKDYSRYIWVRMDAAESNKDRDKFELYLYPAPKFMRTPIRGIEQVDEFSEALQRGYVAAINAYNTQQWVASVVLCGRVLEGIATSFSDEINSKAGLAQLLHELPGHVNLEQPIIDLADSLRIGRNIGAHFDVEREPDSETAEMMIFSFR
jgi:hypothetical protein